MPQPSAVGTARASKNELTYGALEVLDLPTGGKEFLPVALVTGDHDGPCMWLVANIHGAEVTGTAVLHTLLREIDPAQLSGTLVVLPTLNPAGMRAGTRSPYYDERDPNRSFPGRRRDTGEEYFPTVYEQIAQRVFEQIRASADYLIDIHNAQLRSIPYSIRDRVLYRAEAERAGAEKLSDRLDGMVWAFGALVVNEDVPKPYVARELHRSTAGAALNELGIPAMTLELGASRVVDQRGYEAGVRGVRSVLRWAGMLHDGGEALSARHTPYGVRSIDHPRSPGSGIVHPVAQPGDHLHPGDTVARLSDIWGRPIGEGEVRAEHEGWVIGLPNGSLAYRHAPLAYLAVRDDEPLVAPWPES